MQIESIVQINGDRIALKNNEIIEEVKQRNVFRGLYTF